MNRAIYANIMIWEILETLKNHLHRAYHIFQIIVYLGVIQKTPDFSIFAHILKLSGMEEKLASGNANVTIFVPSNQFLVQKYTKEYFEKLDRGDALNIILFSTMNRILNKKILQSSPTSLYPTKYRSHYMPVFNGEYDTFLQTHTKVIHWNYKVDNGIIHVVDDLLSPKNNT